MKHTIAYFFSLMILFTACKEDDKKRMAENKKDAHKKELIFLNIEKGWVFYDEPINETAEASVKTWNEFRLFLAELSKKPKNTIGAFQQKATAIANAANNLNNNIPLLYDKPQIKSRIAVVITKANMMSLYIHLDKIQDDKVVLLISEINKELASLEREMDIITEKNKIPLEEGEIELKQMLDLSRAIPTTTQPNNIVPVE